MVFFRKKKEEDIKEIKEAVEGRKIPEKVLEKPKEEKIEKEKIIPEKEKKPTPLKPEKPTFAPLFVKIDRYKTVLNLINDLKTTIMMIKNSLGIQKQIENLRDENRKLLETAIDKVDKKILSLDSEFLRPKGYEEEIPPPVYETEGLGGIVNNLKKQIEGLKSELETIS